MVEEKAIYSIEKFLVARRLMYWQVYLHKTVLSAEMMLVKLLERVKELGVRGDPTLDADDPLNLFLLGKTSGDMEQDLDLFTQLDDTDVVSNIKKWSRHQDPILRTLSNALQNRKLFKLRLQAEPIEQGEVEGRRVKVASGLGIDVKDAAYLVFTGEAVNSLYNPDEEGIHILFKDGTIRNISSVDNALIHQNLLRPVKKFYICYIGA